MSDPAAEFTTERFHAMAVPDWLAQMCKNASTEMAVDLGESPEAWRGAAVVCALIQSVTAAEATSSVDEDGNPTISEPAIALLLTMAMLQEFPMWPEGEPKLIVDGEPDEPRGHFRVKEE